MFQEMVGPDPFFSSIHNAGGMSFMAGMPTFHPVQFPTIVPKEETGMMGMMGGGLMMGRKLLDDEMESGSGSGNLDGLSCGEEQVNQPLQNQRKQTNTAAAGDQPPAKKKRYHRHTAHQIQEMEALFKECPHPDDKQRLKLSQELGLKPRQVKFWFQNRRTQMKAQQDRADNVVLRAENQTLKTENYRLQAAIRNVICPSCGGAAVLGEMSLEEQHLRLDNARLKEELQRLSCIASRYGQQRERATLQPIGPAPPQPVLIPSLDLEMGVYARNFTEPILTSCTATDIIPGGQTSDSDTIPQPPPPPFSTSVIDGTYGGIILSDHEKALALDLAVAAVGHLVKMCNAREPLWVRSSRFAGEVLDIEEYERNFTWPVELKHHGDQNDQFRVEGTRHTEFVIMNSITLVDAFLDANKWMDLFPSIVSKTKTLQIVSPGVLSGHGNGSLHLMYAELQVLSPLVPTRETHFLRYCQQINQEQGTWVIVDFPIDAIHDGLQLPLSNRYRRRPSGCLIQDQPNGYSRVVWIEHAELAEDKPVHQIFEQFVNTGFAFGATRWLAVLQRQCERLASLMSRNISDLGVIPSPEARTNMMKLSQRMVKTFCANVSYSMQQSWTALSESAEETVRVAHRKNTEPGQPNGLILTAVSTTWLPFSHDEVFNLLTDEQKRPQIDVLSNGNSLHEIAHIANGSHPRNCVSLFRINASSNSSQNVELLIQESSTHPAGGSLIVYATVDVDSVQVAISGEDPSYIPLLPVGFFISPTAAALNDHGNNGDNAPATAAETAGCLMTIGLQVLTSAVPSAKLNLSSVASINSQISNAVHHITSALNGNIHGGTDGTDSAAEQQQQLTIDR